MKLVLRELTHHYLLDTRAFLCLVAHDGSATLQIRVFVTIDGVLEADLALLARTNNLLSASFHFFPFHVPYEVTLARFRF